MRTPDLARLRRLPTVVALVPLVAFCAATLLAGRPARADDDPWLGEDKAKHFAVSALLTSGGYGLARAMDAPPATAAALSAGGALAVGVGKELADLAGAGHASWKDLVADVAGVGTALLFAWLVEGVSY